MSHIWRDVRETLALAAPAALAQLGLLLMAVVDTAMVGPLGAVPLAAVGLGNSLFFAPSVACMGIVMALDPLVAQAFGAGDDQECGVMLRAGLRVVASLAAPLVAVIAGVGALLPLLGIDPAVARTARGYLWMLAPSAPLMLLFVAARSFLQALGRTRPTLYAVAAANVLNLVLNWVFITGHLGVPALGVVGSALATLVARVALVLAMFAVIARRPLRERFGLDRTQAPVTPAQARRVFALGVPIGTQLFAEVGMFSAVALLMGYLGATALAAHQVALTLAATTFMVAVGLGAAASARVGHAVGAGDRARARRAVWVAMGIGVVVMSGGAAAFLSLPGVLIGLFAHQAPVVSQGVRLLRIAAAFQIADGAQAVAAGCLRGAGDTTYPMRAFLLTMMLVGLPVGCVLAFLTPLGAAGLWWGLTAGLLLGALALIARLASGRWWRELRSQ